MTRGYDLDHPGTTLLHWQAVTIFGAAAVDIATSQPEWRSTCPDLIVRVSSPAIRERYDAVLPGVVVYAIGQRPECVDDYYADPDGKRLYAVARTRKWEDPSSAEAEGMDRIPCPAALLTYGSYCLFMAADRGVGYRHEVDRWRLAEGSARQSAETRLLWTADHRGVNFAVENQPWDSMRGIIAHTNISAQAYSAGEAWRTAVNELTLNAASRAFGFNRDLPIPLLEEARRRYEATMGYLRSLGMEIHGRPFGDR